MAAERAISIKGDIAAPKLIAKNVEPSKLRGAVSFQDLNKRPTATHTLRGGRSLRGGRR